MVPSDTAVSGHIGWSASSVSVAAPSGGQRHGGASACVRCVFRRIRRCVVHGAGIGACSWRHQRLPRGPSRRLPGAFCTLFTSDEASAALVTAQEPILSRDHRRASMQRSADRRGRAVGAQPARRTLRGPGRSVPATRRAAGHPRPAPGRARSSERAAAMAVSMLVRHRMPSETAASRIAAASRTGPERGDGVFTTSDTSPDAMTSRIARRALGTGRAHAAGERRHLHRVVAARARAPRPCPPWPRTDSRPPASDAASSASRGLSRSEIDTSASAPSGPGTGGRSDAARSALASATRSS